MKTCAALYAEMKQHYCEKTGFSMADTADLAVRLQACAAQLESLYRYADWCVAQAFPQTAVGENLDRQGELRALSRNGGFPAMGQIVFSIPMALGHDLSIPAGTVCCTAGLQRFVTIEPGAIAAGQTECAVPAMAETAGEAGNVAANTVTVLTLAPAGITACTNPAPFEGGTDAENDEHYRARILASYASLPNGANAEWYRQRALDYDGVAAATVLPRVNGVGTVGVIIAAETGVPDQALIDEVRWGLQAAREIAVDVSVSGPQVVPVQPALTLKPKAGVSFATASAAAEEAVRKTLSGGQLGKSVYRSGLIAAIMATGAVENCTVSSPAADLILDNTQLAVLTGVSIAEEA